MQSAAAGHCSQLHMRLTWDDVTLWVLYTCVYYCVDPQRAVHLGVHWWNHGISGSLEMVKVYCPGEGSFEEDLFKELFGWENVLICGDFNARSVCCGEV